MPKQRCYSRPRSTSRPDLWRRASLRTAPAGSGCCKRERWRWVVAGFVVWLAAMPAFAQPVGPVFCWIEVEGSPSFVRPSNLSADRYPVRLTIVNGLASEIRMEEDSYVEAYWHVEYAPELNAYVWTDRLRSTPHLLRRTIVIGPGQRRSFGLLVDDPLMYRRYLSGDHSVFVDEDPGGAFLEWRAEYESAEGYGIVECSWPGG